MAGSNQDKDCLFCKIATGEIPADFVKEEEGFVAIKDINPQAPTHVLLIPRQHATNITEVEDTQALGMLFQAAGPLARELNLTGGFRLVVNTGAEAGQTVDHLHVHLLGGRILTWPPG